VASPFAAGVLEVFEKHRIMEDVVFRWSHADPGAFLVVGPRSGDVIASVAADLPALGALAIPVRELTSSDTLLGFDSLHRERIRDLCVRRGAVSVGWQAFDRRRVEVGRAWFGIDADGERLVPEPGFEDRIHYNKGCYLGQEPLARLHFRGRPNWALVRLEGGLSPGLAPGADLLDEGGARVGWITSVAPGTDDVVALGYLHRRFRETAVATVSAEGGHSLGWTED
jgi:folate-binding protein YgfZ